MEFRIRLLHVKKKYSGKERELEKTGKLLSGKGNLKVKKKKKIET